MDPRNQLTYCAPEDVGITSESINGFLNELEANGLEAHSLLLLRHGRVAAQGWWAPYAPNLPHELFSLSKSFTSTAAGLCIAEGRFALDDPVLAYFSDVAPEHPDENLAAMRVRDLLSMSTGHEEEPWAYIKQANNWVAGFLSAPVPHRPGTYFLYNSLATFMVSALVQRVTGEKLVDYLYPRLFAPLGIDKPDWKENGDGIAVGGWGLYLKTEDIARFGQLLLQEGTWNGVQLVPRQWVRMATAWQVDNSRDRVKDWAQGYGFQFWRCCGDHYRGDGMYGQYCVVMPKHDVVLAMTCGTNNMQGVLDAAWKHLLPGFYSALPPNPIAANALEQRLQSLALPMPRGDAGAVIAPQLLDKRLRITFPSVPSTQEESLELQLSENDGALCVQVTKPRKFRFLAGYGKNMPFTGKFFKGVDTPHGRPCTASAAVRADGSVLLHIIVTTAPMRIEIELQPCGDGIEARAGIAPNKSIKDMTFTAVTVL